MSECVCECVSEERERKAGTYTHTHTETERQTRKAHSRTYTHSQSHTQFWVHDRAGVVHPHFVDQTLDRCRCQRVRAPMMRRRNRRKSGGRDVRAQTQTPTHTHIHTHTYTHTRTHTHTHTHVFAASPPSSLHPSPLSFLCSFFLAPLARALLAGLKHEQLFLDHLPDRSSYEVSFMHRDVVAHVAVTTSDFVITTSVDGHLKFWKKKDEGGIEFVKHFKAHLGACCCLLCCCVVCERQ